MIKIDFNYKFVNFDGTTIPERPDEPEEVDGVPVMKDGKPVMKKSPPFTLRTACVNVLTMHEVDERGRAKEISGKDKVERYELAKRIYHSKGLVEISPEEQVLLKELVGRIYPPITVGQAYEILDPHSAEQPPSEPPKS